MSNSSRKAIHREIAAHHNVLLLRAEAFRSSVSQEDVRPDRVSAQMYFVQCIYCFVEDEHEPVKISSRGYIAKDSRVCLFIRHYSS
jgi:hypothetical protein